MLRPPLKYLVTKLFYHCQWCESISVGKIVQGKGQGRPEKFTGPPRPASASRRLIITAMAASPLPSSPRGGSGGEVDGGVVEFKPLTSGIGDPSPPAELSGTLFRTSLL